MGKELNPWNMTKIDLSEAGAEIYRKTGINTGLVLNEDEKAAVLKAILKLAEEWELEEKDILVLKIYLIGKYIFICPHCGKEIEASLINQWKARQVGSVTSEKKAKTSAKNGKKGGRPKKQKD